MGRVKICGNTTLEDARKASQVGADALGFIFFKESKRYISPKEASHIIRIIPPFISCIGVFVNEKKENVQQIAEGCKLDGVQFHGNESPEYCRSFLQRYKVIKAIKVKDEGSLEDIAEYSALNAILLDTYKENLIGGTGEKFKWDLAIKAKKDYEIPIILAGGLSTTNVKRALQKVNPYAVDVASGVEERPGKKDFSLLEDFIHIVKTYNK